LIKSGAEGNSEAFRQFSQQVIDEERGKQHHLLANDLERILYGQYRAGMLSHQTAKAPEEPTSGVPLLWVQAPRRTLDELVLSDDVELLVSDIAEQFDRMETLAAYGLRPAAKILLYGPPGTGKTALAEALAFRLERDFAIVRLDSLVSSLLGETASNLQRIFSFIEQNELVVLFDEFDAIASERDLGNDHGELKRVVNSVLQMIDRSSSKSLLIAATNHEQNLDSAIWRRFDEVCRLGLPDRKNRLRFLTLRFRGARLNFELEDSELIAMTEGWSFADLQRVSERVYRDTVLRNAEFVERAVLLRAISREASRMRRKA
jgi:SpoVK/Ycf46/Vps4 family AAA+-type ATPase